MAVLSEFTAAEIAKHSGVTVATVRTVIDRERHRLEEIGSEESDGRGGRWRRFRLLPQHRQPPERPLAEPSSLIAAERYLTQAVFETAERQELLERERLTLDACRSLIARNPRYRTFETKLNILEALWFLYDEGQWRTRAIPPLRMAVRCLHKLPVESSLGPAAADASDPLSFFLQLRESSAGDGDSHYRDAASTFQTKLRVDPLANPLVGQIASKLATSTEITTDPSWILALGCDGRSYRPQAVRVAPDRKSLFVRSIEYAEPLRHPETAHLHAYPITSNLKKVAAAAAGGHI